MMLKTRIILQNKNSVVTGCIAIVNIYNFNSEKLSRSIIDFFTICRLLMKSLHFFQIRDDKVMPYDDICANYSHH